MPHVSLGRLSLPVLLTFLVGAFLFCPSIDPIQAVPVPLTKSIFKKGDVVAGTFAGEVIHFRKNGDMAQKLMTGVGEITDLVFNQKGANDLYIVEFTLGQIQVFDRNGNDQGAFGVFPTGMPLGSKPVSIDFDKRGNAFVGWAPPFTGPGQMGVLQKYDAAGKLVQSWMPATINRGVDFITLTNDECTLLYTSLGPVIKAFNLCSGKQLPDFASVVGIPGAGRRVLDIRAEKNGDVIASTLNNIVRFNHSGTPVQTYDLSGRQAWFGVSLSQKGDRFWAVNSLSGDVVEFKEDSNAGEVTAILNLCPGGIGPCPGQVLTIGVFDEKEDPKPKT